MKILIYPGHHDWMDAVIKALTHGKGSHFAFLRADNARVHEAFWPRVRTRPLTDFDRVNAEVYQIAGVTEEQHERFEALFDYDDRHHIEYSIADLFRYALNRPAKDERHTFCSRYGMHRLQAVLPQSLWPLVRLPDRDWASPRDFRISPALVHLKGFFRAHDPHAIFD